VAALCLRDNYEQNVLLAMTRYIGPAMVTVHARVLEALEDRAGWTARWNNCRPPRSWPA